MPIFRVKSVRIYTDPKKFTRVYPWLPWQIWGMQDILVYIFMSLYVPLPMNYSCSCLKMRLCWSQEVFAWFAIANRILSCEKSSFETTIVGMKHFWRLRWEAASAPLQFLSSSLGSCTNTNRICKKKYKVYANTYCKYKKSCGKCKIYFETTTKQM